MLFIEATAYPGKGRLQITGQLGEVMQESAQAALSWVRSNTEELGLPPDWFAEHDVHVHVPAGAVPKDGPSAGVTMATAIASLVRGEPVADDVGMTGEITLTGQVLPIGGLREKSLAAQRAGLKRVIFPSENEPDLDELPPETRAALEFIPAERIEDVFDAAFDGKRRARPRTDAERSSASPLSRREARDQLTASVVAPGRLAAAEQLELPPATQHERVLVDVVADVDVVRVRLDASRDDRPSG